METPERYEGVHRQMEARGLVPGSPDRWPFARLESGHTAHWGLGDRWWGTRGRWHARIEHPGDPTGRWIHADLGDDDSQVSERLLSELRHPDVVREMGEQWRRATAAGDPHGLRDPRYAEDQGERQYQRDPSHVFRHYE
jgi:hypothetical protein